MPLSRGPKSVQDVDLYLLSCTPAIPRINAISQTSQITIRSEVCFHREFPPEGSWSSTLCSVTAPESAVYSAIELITEWVASPCAEGLQDIGSF